MCINMTSQPQELRDHSHCKYSVEEVEHDFDFKITNVTTIRPEDWKRIPIVVEDEHNSNEKAQSVQADDTVRQAQPGASDEDEDGQTAENQIEKSNTVSINPTTVDNTSRVAIGQKYMKLKYSQNETKTVNGSPGSCFKTRPESEKTNSLAKPSLPSTFYPKRDQYSFSPNTVSNVTKDKLKDIVIARISLSSHSNSNQVTPQIKDNLEENITLTGTLEPFETEKTIVEKLTGQSTVPVPAFEYLNGEDTNSSNTSRSSDSIIDSLRSKILCKGVKSDQATNVEPVTTNNTYLKTKNRKEPSGVKKTRKSKDVLENANDSTVSTPGPNIQAAVTVSMPWPNDSTASNSRPNIPTTVVDTDECPSPRKKRKGKNTRRN